MNKNKKHKFDFSNQGRKKVKARTCINGNSQQEYTVQDKAETSTARTESSLITAVIGFKQKRDVMATWLCSAFETQQLAVHR